MSIDMQPLLDLGHELVVDLFAGGGGASEGIKQALGRDPDVAVNHDPEAIAMHQANHPGTVHYCESVFSVDPVKVTRNQPVGLLWASPDCTHHSKAKGGKPVSNKRRGLAWVVIRWARRTRPRVIMLENVEEFADWGPLTAEGLPCKVRKGQTFRQWVGQLERLGYVVEHRELRACDYGAPTIRKRLFVIARRDGRPIVWPKPSHGEPGSPAVRRGKLQPYRTAAECIDWSLPCPSIFSRKRPLAEATMRRIAMGVVRFVIEAAEPFIVTCNHGGDGFRGQRLLEPMRTITAAHDAHGLVIPHITKFRTGSIGHAAGEPLHTITTAHSETHPGGSAPLGLVTAFLAKHYGGVVGTRIDVPAGTVTTVDHHAVVAAHMINLKGSDRRARAADEPMATVCAGGTHAGLVAAFLAPYYSSGSGLTGRDLREPAPTVTTVDRLQLVTVQIDGAAYVITDIGMRMLQPPELFRANGFPDDYVIAPVVAGRRLPKYAQVRMCGNSVPPVWPRALVAANFAHEKAWQVAA